MLFVPHVKQDANVNLRVTSFSYLSYSISIVLDLSPRRPLFVSGVKLEVNVNCPGRPLPYFCRYFNPKFWIFSQTAAATGQHFLSVTVRDGDEVTLPCDSLMDDQHNCDPTIWLFSDSRSRGPTVLVYEGQIDDDAKDKSDRLSVTENCSLVIKNVTDEDVGRYACREYRSGQQQGRDAVVLLSVVTMTEHKDTDEVTVICSVSTYGPCDHTVKWLYEGPDNRNLMTSQSSCSASASFSTSHFIPINSELLKCEVTDDSNEEVKVFPFSPPQSSGEDATTTTPEADEVAPTTGSKSAAATPTTAHDEGNRPGLSVLPKPMTGKSRAEDRTADPLIEGRPRSISGPRAPRDDADEVSPTTGSKSAAATPTTAHDEGNPGDRTADPLIEGRPRSTTGPQSPRDDADDVSPTTGSKSTAATPTTTHDGWWRLLIVSLGLAAFIVIVVVVNVRTRVKEKETRMDEITVRYDAEDETVIYENIGPPDEV